METSTKLEELIGSLIKTGYIEEVKQDEKAVCFKVDKKNEDEEENIINRIRKPKDNIIITKTYQLDKPIYYRIERNYRTL